MTTHFTAAQRFKQGSDSWSKEVADKKLPIVSAVEHRKPW